jgi:hypothetical protein
VLADVVPEVLGNVMTERILVERVYSAARPKQSYTGPHHPSHKGGGLTVSPTLSQPLATADVAWRDSTPDARVPTQRTTTKGPPGRGMNFRCRNHVCSHCCHRSTPSHVRCPHQQRRHWPCCHSQLHLVQRHHHHSQQNLCGNLCGVVHLCHRRCCHRAPDRRTATVFLGAFLRADGGWQHRGIQWPQ